MEKMKAGSRKPHRKTRTGCKTCKQRKIKCGEQRPQCTNCVKHSVPCDYLHPSVQSTANSEASYHSPLPPIISPHEPPSIGPSSLSSQLSSHHPPGLNMLDLELLHNFCTSTCLTLHQEPNLKNLWKLTVPQIGLQYDFVMRGILATSALHIAHFVPERRSFYLSQALIQHQSGLQTATSLLPHITDENCEAVWIFSTLTLFFTLATARQTNEFWMVGESIGGGWLDLISGTSSILRTYHTKLQSGSLGPMFRIGAERAELRESASYHYPIEKDPLQDLRVQMTNSTLKPEDYDLCMQAVEELRKSFALFQSGENSHGSEFSDVFIWLFRVNNGFLSLIRNHCQEALSIFAYFCVLLKFVDYKWWMEGSSVHLIEQIWSMLDDDHRLWIRWPIEEIGWVPPTTIARSHANTPAPAAQMEVDSAPPAPSVYMSPHGPTS